MSDKSESIIYQTDDGLTKIDVRLDEDTVWLTQAEMVELFQSSKSNISEHIKHIFEEGELSAPPTEGVGQRGSFIQHFLYLL